MILLLLTGLVLGWLVLWPLVFVVQASFTGGHDGATPTLENFANIFAAGGAGPVVLANSVIFALGSALVALIWGTLQAWLAERTNVPGRRLAYAAAYASFAVPGIVKAVGWILLLGPRAGLINVWLRQFLAFSEGPLNLFTLGGMILVEGLLWLPIVFLFMAAAFRTMDPVLEEAAYVAGAGRWRTLLRVTLPLALPSLLGLLLLTVARALEAFETPALIGIPAGVTVFTTEIYLVYRSGFVPHYGELSAYSLLLVVLVGLVLYPYHRATRDARRFATTAATALSPRPIVNRFGRYLLSAVLLLQPALLILPLLALAWASLLPYFQPPSPEAFASLSFESYQAVLASLSFGRAAVNSLAVGIVAASGTVALTVTAAWLVVRGRGRGRWVLDELATLPFVIPGIVVGIALLGTYLVLPVPVYGTIWLLVIALSTRALPYGMRYGYAGMLGLQRDLEDSARVCGASWWVTMRRVVVPLIWPAVSTAWITVFLLATRELSSVLVLYTPGSRLVSITMWELWQNGEVAQLGALCVLFLAGLGLPFVLLHRLGRRLGRAL
ncbi:MAG: iron ABC transporter permease [Chloroflexi bacterium]|nr:iron ABC transporter permease [Chloroflexota bacterium]